MADDPAGRRRRVALAGWAGDPAVARAGLDDPDPAVRASALLALDRLAELHPAELSAASRDPEAAVRRTVAELAPAALPAILTVLLDDADATVVEVAAWAAGETDPDQGPAFVPRLAELATDHEDPLVREAAVAALGAIGHPDGLPAILAATRDKATVRRRAVLALAPFDAPEVDAALERARSDRDWQVRQAAEDLA